MTKELFAQCTLERADKDGTIRTVCWIQARHKKGSRVRDDNDIIWTVKERGDNLLPEDLVKEHSSDYRRHRDATDI